MERRAVLEMTFGDDMTEAKPALVGGMQGSSAAAGTPAAGDRQRLMDEIENLMSSLQTRAGN